MSGDPKYKTLIDAQTWAFIHKTESHYPPDADRLDIAGQRRVYDRMCAAFHAGRPAGVTVQDSLQGHIPLRHYRCQSAAPVEVLYLHGGGFVLGGLDSHDDICAEICAATGFDVTAVDYRLSPEHPFPQDIDDALAAARALRKPFVLVGDSAGGTLCATVAAEFSPAPLGQVLIYPSLGPATPTSSMADHAHAPMLTAKDSVCSAKIRAAGNARTRNDPRFSPLCAPSFAGVPPTVVISAECDPLADDAALYAAAINTVGGRAVHIREVGLVHGYLRARHSVDRARASFARIIAAISALGRGVWPPAL
jgi:acetyl esterase